MKILITKGQLNKILSEQSVIGAPNYGTLSDFLPTKVKKNVSSPVKTTGKLPYQNFTNEDTDIFKKILSGVGAPITPETLGFMYAWRQGESSLAVEEKFYCNNPFSTTWDSDPKGSRKAGVYPGGQKSTMYSRTNSHHVRSYKKIETGIDSTVKTILSRFSKIANALKTDGINCHQMAVKCSSDLDKWGTTGAAVKSITNGYLKGKTPNPRPINRAEGCY
jgi:hypothetical protein